jgi:N-acetyl-beta-hexosaminidase
MYLCNGVRLSLTNRVLGASQTMWHMSASAVVSDYLGGEHLGSTCEGYIRSLGIRAERTWGPNTVVQEPEYQKRLAATRTLLDKLLFPVRIDGAPVEYQAWPVLGRQYCTGPVTVTLSLTNTTGNGEIRYTVDGSEPTAQSPVYAAPFTVKKTTPINAGLFRGGHQAGAVTRTVFDMKEADWTLYQ